jgi:N-acetylmuramoyl-L-alanine amidase
MKLFLKRFLSLFLALTFAALLFTSNSLTAEAKKKAKATPKKNIVVVIDPGHDTTHLGCHYEGFEEGVANLMIGYYLIQELQRYDGVTVYCTRGTLECPYGADPDSASKCLASRVNFAKNVKADVMVSLHNDYDPDLDVTQNGAKVIVPNQNYRADICVKGTTLGQSILTQLTTTGLNINNWKLNPTGNGIVTRDATTAKYPDGSARDYYAIINQAKTSGFPCIIVEHAFCTNASDRLNHLTTPEQLQQLGVADATGIANYYGLKLKK